MDPPGLVGPNLEQRDADKNLDYLEVAPTLVRRPHSSGSAGGTLAKTRLTHAGLRRTQPLKARLQFGQRLDDRTHRARVDRSVVTVDRNLVALVHHRIADL